LNWIFDILAHSSSHIFKNSWLLR